MVKEKEKMKITFGNVLTIVSMLLATIAAYISLVSSDIKTNGRIDVLESSMSFQQKLISKQNNVIDKNTNVCIKLDKTLAVLIGKLNIVNREELNNDMNH